LEGVEGRGEAPKLDEGGGAPAADEAPVEPDSWVANNDSIFLVNAENSPFQDEEDLFDFLDFFLRGGLSSE
jgi:hypothetical protein